MGIQIEIGKVYKRKEIDALRREVDREGVPSIQVISDDVTGIVDNQNGLQVYVSNKATKPADDTEMMLTGDVLKHGIHSVDGRTTWILLKKVTGADGYEAWSEGLIRDTSTQPGADFNEDA